MTNKKSLKAKDTQQRDPSHGTQHSAGPGRKSGGETQGQYERDPKRRTGQYTGAGDAPLMKK